MSAMSWRMYPASCASPLSRSWAAMLLERARDLGLPARLVAGDEVYGGRDLRMRIRELGYDYTMAVPDDHYVTTRAGRFTAAALAARLPLRAWQRLKTGQGGKGDRHYDWAMIEVIPDDTLPGHAAGHALLLVRRHRYTRELSFYRCHSVAAVALGNLVAVVCRRRRTGEDFQVAKSLSGLDQGQATCWNSWMRWSLTSMIAYTILAVTTARSRAVIPASAEAKLIPLTCRELLTLLRASQPRRDLAHVLHWSQWRRRHQHRAAACHRHWNEVTAVVMT